MRKTSLTTLAAGMLFAATVWGQTNNCDLNGDGKVDNSDVQAAINMSLGVSNCTANIVGPNVCNVVVVQRVINASMGNTCITSAGIHSVALTWTASTSSGVTGYQVYRGTSTGGPYSLLSTAGLVTNYTDYTVVSGSTYYYVLTSVSGSNISPYSNEAKAVIPVP
jgi:hypothetical protein